MEGFSAYNKLVASAFLVSVLIVSKSCILKETLKDEIIYKLKIVRV